MKELIEELDKAIEATKDYNTIGHLFSGDEGVKILAELRQTVNTIKHRVELSTFKEIGFPKGRPIKEEKETGRFVSIRPCGEEYKNQTFLGLYLGRAALSSEVVIAEDKIVCRWSFYNPAILILSLNKIVYGCESWWGTIDSESDLEKITDTDIENVWYVKALKQLTNTPKST